MVCALHLSMPTVGVHCGVLCICPQHASTCFNILAPAYGVEPDMARGKAVQAWQIMDPTPTSCARHGGCRRAGTCRTAGGGEGQAAACNKCAHRRLQPASHLPDVPMGTRAHPPSGPHAPRPLTARKSSGMPSVRGAAAHRKLLGERYSSSVLRSSCARGAGRGRSSAGSRWQWQLAMVATGAGLLKGRLGQRLVSAQCCSTWITTLSFVALTSACSTLKERKQQQGNGGVEIVARG